MSVFDKPEWHGDPTHLVVLVTWLMERGLLAHEPAREAEALEVELMEDLGALAAEVLTPEGADFVEAVYEGYVEEFGVRVELVGGSVDLGMYREHLRPWLDSLLARVRAGRQVGSRLDALNLVAEGLGPMIAAEGLEPVAERRWAWARSSGELETGFWLQGPELNEPPPLGGAFLVRVGGGWLGVGEGAGRQAENRLPCWIGQPGRDGMRAIHQTVWAKLPAPGEWPTVGPRLTPPKRPYTPNDDLWCRYSDREDLDAWVTWLSGVLPTVLADMEAHFE